MSLAYIAEKQIRVSGPERLVYFADDERALRESEISSCLYDNFSCDDDEDCVVCQDSFDELVAQMFDALEEKNHEWDELTPGVNDLEDFRGRVEDLTIYVERLEEDLADERATVKALAEQIDELAYFIQREVPGEPSESEGAVDTAIRVIKQLQTELKAHKTVKAMNDELAQNANKLHDLDKFIEAEVPGVSTRTENGVSVIIRVVRGLQAQLKVQRSMLNKRFDQVAALGSRSYEDELTIQKLQDEVKTLQESLKLYTRKNTSPLQTQGQLNTTPVPGNTPYVVTNGQISIAAADVPQTTTVAAKHDYCSTCGCWECYTRREKEKTSCARGTGNAVNLAFNGYCLCEYCVGSIQEERAA